MISSTSRTASRRLALNARTAGKRNTPGRRFNSSTSSSAGPSTSAASAATSPLAAGIAGGAVVLLGGYGYYHLSGTKSMVDSAKSVHQSFKSAKDAALEKAPAPNEVITYLRNITKSYASLVPGASGYIDASFDAIDELHQSHKDEVDAIVNNTYENIKKAVNEGGMDAKTASKIFSILKAQSVALGELAKNVGGDIIGPVLDKHPELKEKLGSGWDDLKQLMKDAEGTDIAQQAKSIYDDTTKQLSDAFSSGFSPDALLKAKKLVEEKAKEVRDLSQQAAKKVWEKGQKEYLDKAPEDVKKLFSNQDTMTALMSGSGATATVVALWGKVKDISTSKGGFDEKNVQQLKDFIQQKMEEAKNKAGEKGVPTNLDDAWKVAQSWLKTVPGGEKALQSVPDIDIASLSKIATSKGDEAKELAQETWSDVLKVLKEKSDKAKKLAEGAKDDASSGKDEGSNDDSKKQDEGDKKGKEEKKDDKKKGKK